MKCDNNCKNNDCIYIQAVETVLKALENSIPKKKIEEELENWENMNKIKSSATYNQDELIKILTNELKKLLEDK